MYGIVCKYSEKQEKKLVRFVEMVKKNGIINCRLTNGVTDNSKSSCG
jgi:hypothetical protein